MEIEDRVRHCYAMLERVHTNRFFCAVRQRRIGYDERRFSCERGVAGAIETLWRFIKGGKNDATLSLMFDLVIQLLNEKCVALQRDPVVEEVCRLLALHYNDPQLSVSALLETTGYNKDHIRRRFISVRGVTPSEYLASLRIGHAKQLLKRKNELQLSVADIGEMCGYYDPHYFSRIFKKETGIPPEKFASRPEA
jgi:AraC-like DNA-binding protein